MGLFASCCFEIGFSSLSFQRGNTLEPTKVHHSTPESSGTSVDISGHHWSAHPSYCLYWFFSAIILWGSRPSLDACFTVAPLLWPPFGVFGLFFGLLVPPNLP